MLTKADSIAGVNSFNLCFSYKHNGRIVTDFNPNPDFLREVRPVYTSYEGYLDISECKSYAKLPKNLRVAVRDFEKFIRAEVAIVSVGPKRNQTIIK